MDPMGYEATQPVIHLRSDEWRLPVSLTFFQHFQQSVHQQFCHAVQGSTCFPGQPGCSQVPGKESWIWFMMNHGKSRQEPPTLWLLTGKPWQVSPLNPVTCGLVREGLLAMHHSHQARKRQGMTRILQRGRLIQLNQLGHQCEIPAHLSTWLLKIWWICCDLLGCEKWRPSATATSTHGALAPCCSHQRMLSCVETQEVWVQTAIKDWETLKQ